MPKDLKLINPNTRTCPIFRSRRDAEITRNIYQKVPVLWNEKTGDNPWDVSFQAMFHMANDSNLFETHSSLITKGCKLEGNIFVNGDEKWLPLYEAKMVWQYNHRFNTYRDNETIGTTQEELSNPKFCVYSRYFVQKNNLEMRLGLYSKNCILGWRDITNATNKRTVVASFIPKTAVGDTFLLILPDGDTVKSILLCANLNSMVLDYCARQKTGGMHIKYNIIKQLPLIPPIKYNQKIKENITKKVVELVYSSKDICGFAEDVLKEIGNEKWNLFFPQNPVTDGAVKPFKWDEEKRFSIQRELDAIYAYLYELSRDDLEYILNTFPIIEKSDIEKYGYFKTKEDVLRYYDEYSKILSYSS